MANPTNETNSPQDAIDQIEATKSPQRDDGNKQGSGSGTIKGARTIPKEPGCRPTIGSEPSEDE